jgi:IMP dehydrogenase
MLKVRNEIGLTFDDVILVPRFSTIDSRFNGEIDLSTRLTKNISLKIPIISANMDTVTSDRMAQVMYTWGGLGIPHRFMTPNEQRLALEINGPKVVCIGVGHSSRERLDNITMDLSIDAVLIDIAHGHCQAMIDQIKWVKDNYPDIDIIAGNVATQEGCIDLINAGVNSIKCGVGPGSLCTTRIKTGNGVPQLTAIADCAEVIMSVNTPVSLIADGGIRSSGDILKALAAGADAVMVGSLLAGAWETPGDIILSDNSPSPWQNWDPRKPPGYKLYRGMASESAQKSWKGYVSSIEGEIKRVDCKGPVVNILEDLKAGLLSGMSYQNARNISELQTHCEFVRQTYYGHREGLPHGLLS